MHDSGPLVPPKEEEDNHNHSNNSSTEFSLVRLIAAVQQARRYNDAYLTGIIEENKDEIERRNESIATGSSSSSPAAAGLNNGKRAKKDRAGDAG